MRIPAELPQHIPPDMLAKNASNDMLLFTAAISILIGAALTWLGWHGKQMWMVAWSIGLIIAAIAMAIAILFL